MLRRLKKGQSTAEYAIVIGLVIAAVVAMQTYVKRGIQGKMRDASDAPIVVDGLTTDNTMYGMDTVDKQFEPTYTSGTDLTSTREGTQYTAVSAGGGVERGISGSDVSNRTGNQITQAPN
jgi:Flp pilus assembly pilin Flp